MTHPAARPRVLSTMGRRFTRADAHIDIERRAEPIMALSLSNDDSQLRRTPVQPVSGPVRSESRSWHSLAPRRERAPRADQIKARAASLPRSLSGGRTYTCDDDRVQFSYVSDRVRTRRARNHVSGLSEGDQIGKVKSLRTQQTDISARRARDDCFSGRQTSRSKCASVYKLRAGAVCELRHPV